MNDGPDARSKVSLVEQMVLGRLAQRGPESRLESVSFRFVFRFIAHKLCTRVRMVDVYMRNATAKRAIASTFARARPRRRVSCFGSSASRAFDSMSASIIHANDKKNLFLICRFELSSQFLNKL